MRRSPKVLVLPVLLCATVLLAAGWRAPDPIRVALITGQANPAHAWRYTTPVLTRALQETGLFDVTVITVSDDQVGTFRPAFDQYQVVVMNYDGDDWPADTRAAFERYMSSGGGLVVVHAANNAFPRWAAWNEMIGIGGWRGRNETCGPYWYYRDDQLVKDETPGHGGSHPGGRLPFRVTVRQPTHPIMRGLPTVWLHHSDELYATLRGPGRNMTVLATGYSDPSRGGQGTDRDEPVLLALSYGQGRVFHTAFGHDVAAMSSVDFVTTLQRGTEWAATGRVTQPVPAGYPTAEAVSYRLDIANMAPPAPAAAAPQGGAARAPAAAPAQARAAAPSPRPAAGCMPAAGG